jgi:hypothetical protein
MWKTSTSCKEPKEQMAVTGRASDSDMATPILERGLRRSWKVWPLQNPENFIDRNRCSKFCWLGLRFCLLSLLENSDQYYPMSQTAITPLDEIRISNNIYILDPVCSQAICAVSLSRSGLGTCMKSLSPTASQTRQTKITKMHVTEAVRTCIRSSLI